MRRYARRVAEVGFTRSQTTAVWLVIRTDDVSPGDVIAQGFESVPDELTDDEVMAHYSVRYIYTVTDTRLDAFPQ